MTNVIGGTGENTPFTERSKEKERDKGHDKQGFKKLGS